MKYVVKTILYDIAEQDPQVDNYANEDATQNPTSQARIRTLATQILIMINSLTLIVCVVMKVESCQYFDNFFFFNQHLEVAFV